MTSTFPRQPRAGEPANAARVVAHTHPAYDGSSAPPPHPARGSRSRSSPAPRARGTVRDRLNTLFSKPAADLDFIHMMRWAATDAYEVGGPRCDGIRTASITTQVGSARIRRPTTPPGGALRVFEPVTLATVTDADRSWYGLPAHEIAFLWTKHPLRRERLERHEGRHAIAGGERRYPARLPEATTGTSRR